MHLPKEVIELRQDHKNKDAENFFNAEYPILYRYAVYLVKDAETAQDLCQEVFLRWFNLPCPHDIELPRAWLKKVLSNMAFNYLRHQKIRFKWETDTRENEVSSSIDMKKDLIRMEVEDALSSLAWKEQMLLKMKLADLSYAEMADVMNVSIGSVGTMLTRAMQKFKTAYEGKEAGIQNEMSGSRSTATIC